MDGGEEAMTDAETIAKFWKMRHISSTEEVMCSVLGGEWFAAIHTWTHVWAGDGRTQASAMRAAIRQYDRDND